ncbi:MAG: hypothetical protein JXR94_21155 [Candidatus Hydrogenedentes bacterium]|nr:hypothetical protein [Candidatus Hydrogenedentota bacterium]
MSPFERQEPYGSSGAIDWERMADAARALARFAAAGVGVVFLLAALALAFNVFGLVRGLVEAPGSLNPYLDQWQGVIETPAQPMRDEASPTDEAAISPEPAHADAAAQAGTAAEGEAPAEAGSAAAADTPPPGDAASVEGAAAVEEAPARTPRPPRFKPPADTKPPARSVWLRAVDTLIEAVHNGTLARPVAALLVLLFVLVLAKIPFSIALVGLRMLSAAMDSANKHRRPPPLPSASEKKEAPAQHSG